MKTALNTQSVSNATVSTNLLDFVIRYLGIPIILTCTLLCYHYFINIYPKEVVFGFLAKEVMAFIAASIVMALLLIIAELLRPLEQFKASKAEQLTDIHYSISTGVLFGLLHPLVVKLPELSTLPAVTTWPGWLQFIIGLAYLDFVLYWWHRLLHESNNSVLWKIHEPHHAPERLTFMAGSRAHLFERFTRHCSLVCG